LAGNSKLINKIKAVARNMGYMTRSEDAFGRTDTVTGLTDLYAARLSLDGFHAVALANQDLVKIS
jgi:hypothetical protein